MKDVFVDIIDFLKSNFDKLLLFFWICCLVAALVHFSHRGEAAAYDWAVRAYDNIQGALLMLLTGRAIQQRVADRIGNGGSATPSQKSGN